MTGLDSNILVQLALQDHPANAATVAAVQAEVQRGSRLVFPALVVDEFLHVITDERRFSPPLTMTEALEKQEETERKGTEELPPLLSLLLLKECQHQHRKAKARPSLSHHSILPQMLLLDDGNTIHDQNLKQTTPQKT